MFFRKCEANLRVATEAGWKGGRQKVNDAPGQARLPRSLVLRRRQGIRPTTYNAVGRV